MLTIGAFSKISNVAAKTLRYYDEIGLIKPKYVNDENGYRYYTTQQLETVLLINKLKEYCFTLEEIGEILKYPENDSILLSLIKEKRSGIQGKLSYYKYVLSKMEEDIQNLERGIDIMSYLDNIEVKIVETQPRNVIYFRDEINVQDYGKYFGQLMEKIKKENLTMTGAPISIFHDEEHNPECYDMEIAIPVKERTADTREIQGGPCARAILKGPYSELKSVYAKIIDWTEKEGVETLKYSYEIYTTNPYDTPPTENITEVYFPLKK